MSNDDPDQHVWFDPSCNALKIENLTIDTSAVMLELPYWVNGYRGIPVGALDALAGVDFTPYVRTALELASIVMATTGDAQDAVRLERAVDEAARRSVEAAESVVRSTTTATENARLGVTETAQRATRELTEHSTRIRDELTKQMQHVQQQLRNEIAAMLGADDGPLLGGRLDELLAKVSTSMQENAVRHATELYGRVARDLDPHDPRSPLGALAEALRAEQKASTEAAGVRNKEITNKLEELARTVAVTAAGAAAKAETASVTPLKGGTYAGGVHQHLHHIAADLGDEYRDTSSEVGQVPKCKKGDGLLDVLDAAVGDTEVRIVVEMSNSTARGERGWGEYLEVAERNRGAIASLGLVRTVEQVPGKRALRTFGARRMVVAFDPDTDDPSLLRAAVQLLRIQALYAATRTGTGRVDTAAEKLHEAAALVESLSMVQKHAVSIRRSAEKIDLDCGGLQLSLTRLLREALDALTGAGDDGPVGDASHAA